MFIVLAERVTHEFSQNSNKYASIYSSEFNKVIHGNAVKDTAIVHE